MSNIYYLVLFMDVPEEWREFGNNFVMEHF